MGARGHVLGVAQGGGGSRSTRVAMPVPWASLTGGGQGLSAPALGVAVSSHEKKPRENTASAVWGRLCSHTDPHTHTASDE